MKNSVLLFYDQDCGFCNAWVSFFLKRNTQGRLRFAPLQGRTARELFRGTASEPLLQNLNTLIVRTDSGDILLRSSAALYLFSLCPAPWKWFWHLRYVPRVLRDGVYRLVSYTRKLWWSSTYCVVPTAQERTYFLD